MTKKFTLLYLLPVFCFVEGCIESRSYYLSPYDINANPYHNLPLKSDSFKAATYASAVFTGGSANDRWRDGVLAFQASLHRGHQFGNFQAYYGAGFSLGSYHVARYDGYDYYYQRPDSLIHIPRTNQFFGSYGFNGGMNLVKSFANNRGEWRIIGFETSVQNEFGDYQRFRKGLPDSAINIIAKYSLTATLGVTTEFIRKTRHGTSIGYKIALGGSLISKKKYVGDESNMDPFYFSHTLHVTKGRWTGFGQLNFGLYTGSFQCGINYKLGGKKTSQ